MANKLRANNTFRAKAEKKFPASNTSRFDGLSSAKTKIGSHEAEAILRNRLGGR